MINKAFQLDNRSFLITGASSGIGSEISISLSKMNADLIITGRSLSKLEDTFSLLEGNGYWKIIQLDLEIINELEEFVTKLPLLDGVVLSAGVIKTKPFKFINEVDIKNIFDVNFTSQILLLNHLIRSKKIKKGGSIVFISSIGGNKIGTIGNSIYAASKAAISGIQKVLALELASQKIRVNSICPGMVRTPMWSNGDTITQAQLKADELKYPLGYGEAADVANAAIYLLSDASRWVTGTDLIIDGGFSIQ